MKELYEALMSENIDSNKLLEIIPDLRIMVGFNQKHPHHHLDLWEHTLYALSLSKMDFDIRLSILLHDIGKAYVFYEEDGVRHYPEHGDSSAEVSETILRELGFDEDYISRICFLIRFHDVRITPKMVEENKEIIDDLYEIQRCDALAHNPEKLEKRIKYLEETKQLIKSKK